MPGVVFETTKSEGLYREMEFTVSAEVIEAQLMEQLTKYQKEAVVQGFRKGRVPIRYLRARIDDDIRLNEGYSQLHKKMEELLQNPDDRPVASPVIAVLESPSETQPFRCTISFEVAPDIGEVDLSGIELTRYVPSDKDALLEKIRNEFALANGVTAVQDADYEAEWDDIILYNGRVVCPDSHIHGHLIVDQKLPVRVGPNEADSLYGLVGSKAGDIRMLQQEFPSSRRKSQSKMVVGTVIIEVHAVEKLMPATIDDEFAKWFECNDVDELNQRLLERKTKEFDDVASQLMKEQLKPLLISRLTFELPERQFEKIVQDEIEEHKKDRQSPAGERAAEADDVVLGLDEEMETPESRLEDQQLQLRETVKENLRLGYLVESYSRERGLSASEEEVRQLWESFVRIGELQLTAPDKQELFEGSRHRFEYLVRKDKVLQSIVDELPKKVHPITYDELMLRSSPISGSLHDGLLEGADEQVADSELPAEDDEPEDAVGLAGKLESTSAAEQLMLT